MNGWFFSMINVGYAKHGSYGNWPDFDQLLVPVPLLVLLRGMLTLYLSITGGLSTLDLQTSPIYGVQKIRCFWPWCFYLKKKRESSPQTNESPGWKFMIPHEFPHKKLVDCTSERLVKVHGISLAESTTPRRCGWKKDWFKILRDFQPASIWMEVEFF